MTAGDATAVSDEVGGERTAAKDAKAAMLTTYDLNRLDRACGLLFNAFGHPPYLVGSALNGDGSYRDVDVRQILSDAEFDGLFADRRGLWELLCLTITGYLRDATGLPVDYQIQRMTEANEAHNGPRNPLRGRRVYAGGGDATRFTPPTAAVPVHQQEEK